MIWTILVAVLVLLILAFPYIRERRKAAPTDHERLASGYNFAELSKGLTAYKSYGPTRGKVIVAVHGLTTPSQVWDGLIPHLTQMGYRVVKYDLYGRGLSDAPNEPQTAAFFQRQLLDLLDYLELSDGVTLMGYSMGGAIVTGFAATHRHRVDNVIMIAGAGIHINETMFEKLCRRLPFVGGWLSLAFMERGLRRNVLASDPAHPLTGLRLAQLDQAGYIPAVASSGRYQLSDVQKSEHRILAQEKVRLLAIWAERDEIIPISALGALAQWNRSAQQEVIKGADHDVLSSHAEEVAEAIRELRAN